MCLLQDHCPSALLPLSKFQVAESKRFQGTESTGWTMALFLQDVSRAVSVWQRVCCSLPGISVLGQGLRQSRWVSHAKWLDVLYHWLCSLAPLILFVQKHLISFPLPLLSLSQRPGQSNRRKPWGPRAQIPLKPARSWPPTPGTFAGNTCPTPARQCQNTGAI